MITGTVLSIERCSLHDGPGLRTTVFLKGCPLACLWCHNPESLSFEAELYLFEEKCTGCGACTQACKTGRDRASCTGCGKCAALCPNSAIEIKGIKMTPQEVMAQVVKDVKFYNQSGGGLTISGGEPLAQFDFTLELLRLAKQSGIHTCLETSGQAATSRILALLPYVDLFLFDYKESQDAKHKEFTGVSREQIDKNLHAVNDAGGKIVLRCPIIPTLNDRPNHFLAIAETANKLANIIEVNIMPYHPMGASKAARVGRKYALADIGFTTDDMKLEWIKAIQADTNTLVKQG